MCTLALAWRVFDDTPIVAAANRDERRDRPAEPPAVRDGTPRVVCPRDREAGGTWIGLNEHGLLAAITNRWVDADLTGERSRGLLVADLLAERSATAAGRALEAAVEEHAYEGFNLVLADDAAALYYEYGGGLAFRQLGPGVHVVVNVGADGRYVVPATRPDAGERQATAAEQLREALRPRPDETATAWRDRAAEALADHRFGVCVHEDGFGTRSASLISVGTESSRYLYADGPPCESDFEEVPLEGQF